jgi:hypothetical protein
MLSLTSHAIIPIFPRGGWRNIASPNDEITETLAGKSFERIIFDHRPQYGENLAFSDVFYKR